MLNVSHYSVLAIGAEFTIHPSSVKLHLFMSEVAGAYPTGRWMKAGIHPNRLPSYYRADEFFLCSIKLHTRAIFKKSK